MDTPSSSRDHWEAVYQTADVERLGWHENDPSRSIELIRRCRLSPQDLVLDVGSGASTFIGALLARGHLNVAALDISGGALSRARARLTADQASRVRWIIDDVLNPTELEELESRVKVWHDRALFHFLTRDEDRDRYRATLRALVAERGCVIIAAFSLEGADRCSGLPVRRYDAASIAGFLGTEFELLLSYECVYVTPGGEPRPYVYTLSRRFARESSHNAAGPVFVARIDPRTTIPAMTSSDQLNRYEQHYIEARERARALVGPLTDAQFNWKPAKDRWSVGECLYHLNVISDGYLPVLRSVVAGAPRGVSGPFRYGWLSRKFIAAVTPGTKPVSTAGSMKPPPAESTRSALDKAAIAATFDELMGQFAELIRVADGIDLARTKVRSPFVWLLRLPLGAFLEALGLHALRHLDQARRVTQEAGFPD